jgi:hypothetical protein
MSALFQALPMRTAGRIAGDRYYTPQPVADILVGRIARLIDGRSVWEPHVGGGAFALAAQRAGAIVSVSDLDPAAAGLKLIETWPSRAPYSALDGWPWPELEAPEWVIGNPPYDEAEAHIRAALAVAREGVAFLLRASILSSRGRFALWTTPARMQLAGIYYLAGRPSFDGTGRTDSVDYVWLIWRDGCGPSEPVARWVEIP